MGLDSKDICFPGTISECDHTVEPKEKCQFCLLHLPFDSLVCHSAKENSSADYMKETQLLKQQLISEFKAKNGGFSEIMIAYKPLIIILLHPLFYLFSLPSITPLVNFQVSI